MLAVIENNWDIKYIQILPAPPEGATENIGKIFFTKKFTQCKILRILIDVFKIQDNKNNGKLCSKYELLFLDQANSSSDSSEILILRFLIPGPSLPLSPSLSNLTLFNWNPYSTQSSSCSSPVSLFCPTLFNLAPPQVLDIPNNMASQANKIYHQAVSRSLYLMSQTCCLSKSWVFKSRFSFKVRQYGLQQLYL